MGAMVGMAGGNDLWGEAWIAIALMLTGTSVVCGLAAWRRPRCPWRAFMAATVLIVMVISTVDMALPGRLLSPLAWAAVLLALMLASLPGIRPGGARGARRVAAQHAAGLLFMSVMWLAMLTATSSGPADAAAGATLHAAHTHPAGSLLLPLGWVLVAASVLVVVLVIRVPRWPVGRSGTRQRWAAAQHASMGLAMSAMTVGMIVPLMFS
ncbi:hypothetical protein [Cryobacterium sp. PH31-L1]|uniref:hypothetical protein n=1 Tax=Cryobacterium sp. PH31-L1 TaxID=3046199 RepID=UPI0024BB08A8|nr:hypothetical protein [Cryobacterium sp. PH31-L1]MDJ0376309.1 hypothetical protein [Cryobacterium sp. PH31-L1]